MTFEQLPPVIDAIERLYGLNVGTVTTASGQAHERPHKPLLLLAAFDLIDEGTATPERVPWCRALRDRFTARFEVVRAENDANSPELPFLHLGGDGFWAPFEGDGTSRLQRTPLARDEGRVFARFIDGVEVLAASPEARLLMRRALVERYFPRHAQFLLPYDAGALDRQHAAAERDPVEQGRSNGFRRKVLEVYDHQCAACGLRIRLPEEHDVSFIDAAHLVPFAETHNDHPTNGLALCKNHHWAMDRKLIAPDEDCQWNVSRVLDGRRSSGERALLKLSKKDVILPRDPAFRPAAEGLRWRLERLRAA
ncbi:MAG: HNH endonuclease [Myxococcaceae bacterium]